AMIKSGACDAFKRGRAQLLIAVDKALEAGQKAYRDRAMGQTSLFAAFAATAPAEAAGATPAHETYADTPEWSERERLAAEKEALGFYISGHPLDQYVDDLPRL